MRTYQQKGNISLLTINQKTSKKVFVKNVILLKADINYTNIYLENGKTQLIAHSMKFFEPFLEKHGFLRIHRAFMVNPNHVKTYNQEERKLTMTNGQQAIISRRKEHIIKKFVG